MKGLDAIVSDEKRGKVSAPTAGPEKSPTTAPGIENLTAELTRLLGDHYALHGDVLAARRHAASLLQKAWSRTLKTTRGAS